jgi:hypothetical protein
MKYIIPIILIGLLPFYVKAQTPDFLVLKKKNKTIQSFYSGTPIEFTTVHGVYKNGWITKIQNDSIFIKEYIIRNVMTQMGFYVIDTAGSLSFTYPYKDIAQIGKKSSGFNWSGSGAALLGGGILLTLASGVVYLADHDKFSPELMGAGAGLGLVGYFISRSAGRGIIIGKRKYRLEYVRMTGN